MCYNPSLVASRNSLFMLKLNISLQGKRRSHMEKRINICCFLYFCVNQCRDPCRFCAWVSLGNGKETSSRQVISQCCHCCCLGTVAQAAQRLCPGYRCKEFACQSAVSYTEGKENWWRCHSATAVAEKNDACLSAVEAWGWKMRRWRNRLGQQRERERKSNGYKAAADRDGPPLSLYYPATSNI